jgi:ferritin-like metal-binding protein YciE
MASTETPARDAVLVKYLNEAYGKEKQLEQNLQLLIGRAPNHKTLKKGLQDHLKVTKNQSREIERRVKALGGKAEAGPDLPGPDAASAAAGAVANVANRAVAAAKGPVQMLRGTGEADNMLRNVRDAYWNEGEEIAHYSVIEQVATKLNDKETVQLAKRFRKQEEQMQKFLERQIKALVGEVVKEEVPAAERRSTSGTTRRRSSSSSRSASSGSSSRSTSRSSSGSSSSRSASSGSSSRSSSGSGSSSRKAAGQKAAATRTRKAATSSAKSTAKSARTTAKKAGTTAKKAGSAARSTAKRATS